MLMTNKPGWKTTEFWLSFAAMFIGAITASGAVTNSVVLQGLGLAATALGSMGYSAGRSWAKGKTDAAHASASTIAEAMLKKNSSD